MKNTEQALPIRPEESIHVPHVRCVYGECPCDCSQRCDIWMEFQIAMVSMHDLEELTQGNWIEITRLRTYIDYLEELLGERGIDHLKEYEVD